MAEVLEHVIVKLLGIVNCDFSQDAIATDDVLSEEFLDSHGAYVCNGLHHNPFCEILYCYNSEGVIALS
jgi:hypothetical protein